MYVDCIRRRSVVRAESRFVRYLFSLIRLTIGGKAQGLTRKPDQDTNPSVPPRQIGMKERSNGPRRSPISALSIKYNTMKENGIGYL